MTGYPENRRVVWLYLLPPVLSLGFGYFAWAVAGALQKETTTRAMLALLAAVGLMAVWVAETDLLARLLTRPRSEIARKIALSWAPLFLLPLSAPYFTHRVASSFLKDNPSAGRVLALAVCLLALTVTGSVVLKILLFWHRSDKFLIWLERRAVRFLWAGVAIYFLVFVALAFLAYARFKGFHSDLGQYNQTLWASLRGRIFWSTLEETSPDSYLGTHISPFLLLLLPFYAFRQSPLTYLFLRSLALSLAAVPLFYCVRRITGSAIAGLVLAGAFLLHPEIVSQHFTAGYEVVFVAAFFFSAFYFFIEKRFGWFIFFLVMVLAVREDFIPAALIFAVYALIKRRSAAWILTPLALFIVWEVVTNLIFNLVIVHYGFNLYYGHFGDSPLQMAKTIISHPIYALEEIRRYHSSYLYNLFLPAGLVLPFASAAILFALPSLAFTLARGQDISAASGGISHYSVLVVAALWLSLAGFISIVQKWVNVAGEAGFAGQSSADDGINPGLHGYSIQSRAAVFASVVIAVFVVGTSHLWLYYLPITQTPDTAALGRAIEMVPADVSVSSNDGRALSHLSSRWEVYEPLLWDVPEEPDRLPQGREQLKAEYVLVKPFTNPYYNDAGAFRFLTEPGSRYQLLFDEDGIKLYKKDNISSS
ncbi:MAG: DUF2079 domain-containing protein [Thermoleophilia bacterium]